MTSVAGCCLQAILVIKRTYLESMIWNGRGLQAKILCIFSTVHVQMASWSGAKTAMEGLGSASDNVLYIQLQLSLRVQWGTEKVRQFLLNMKRLAHVLYQVYSWFNRTWKKLDEMQACFHWLSVSRCYYFFQSWQWPGSISHGSVSVARRLIIKLWPLKERYTKLRDSLYEQRAQQTAFRRDFDLLNILMTKFRFYIYHYLTGFRCIKGTAVSQTNTIYSVVDARHIITVLLSDIIMKTVAALYGVYYARNRCVDYDNATLSLNKISWDFIIFGVANS